MKIINISKNIILTENAVRADNFFNRLKGLLGKASFSSGNALVLKPCDSIHTFFMRFAIDAVFLNKQNQVIKIYSHLKPWRLSGIFFNASCCIEFPAGTVLSTHTQEGDTFSFV